MNVHARAGCGRLGARGGAGWLALSGRGEVDHVGSIGFGDERAEGFLELLDRGEERLRRVVRGLVNLVDQAPYRAAERDRGLEVRPRRERSPLLLVGQRDRGGYGGGELGYVVGVAPDGGEPLHHWVVVP